MASPNGRNLRFAATALAVATGLSLLSSASDTATATSTGPASARTHIYRDGFGSVGYVERCCPNRWNAYEEGGMLVGTVRRGTLYRERWNVSGGYAEPIRRGRWNVYEVGRVRRGYVKRSDVNRWDVYGWDGTQYVHEGYAQGPGAVVGGVALLFFLPPR